MSFIFRVSSVSIYFLNYKWRSRRMRAPGLRVAALWAAVLCAAEFADEMLVYDKKCLGENVFHCLNGGCITLEQYCDGKPDCLDASDENMCPWASPEPLRCRAAHEFACADGRRCVPLAWVCNDEPDCEDASDEQGCAAVPPALSGNSTCKGFSCGSGECISALWACDGVYDCADRSDETSEKVCRSKTAKRLRALATSGEACEAVAGGHRCGDGSCVPAGAVCDGLRDCRDGSDEGSFCANWTTMCVDAGCGGGCRPSARGPVCECDSMLRYVNGSCVDIDECVEENVQCSQRCSNLYRGFRCSCDAGYVSDFAEYLCFAKDGEGLVFLTLRNEIRYYKLKSREEVLLATDAKQAHGVTSDGTWVYWVEAAQGHQAVLRAELRDVSHTKQVIVSLGLQDPGDIAIDWLGGQLYLSDVAQGHIAVCRPDGDACAALRDGIKYPRFVTLHPQKGQMYWSDWMDGPVIMRANMDGSDVVKFVEQHHNSPTGLALDVPNERLYWVDGYIHNIMLDGSNRRTVLKGDIHHPYSLAVFENNIYWSDWASNTLQACEKFDGKNRKLLLTFKTPVFGIHVYHPVLMQQQKHGCTDHNCSHFCLLRGPSGHSCACPQHMILQPDERTCIEDGKPEYLLVGGGSSVLRLRYDTLGRPETQTARLSVGRLDALTYDPIGKRLYVFDGVRRSLEYADSRDLDAGLRVVADRNLNQIVDMDYDYVTSSLYWVDAGRRSLEVYSTRTSSRAVLQRFLGGELPLSLCVMADLGEVMVAVQQHELGGSVHIDKFGLDGRGRRRLLHAAYRGPHVRLRYSELHGGVYISDEGNGIIDFMKPDGSSRVNFRELSTSVTSLAVTRRLAFWTDRRTPRLFYSGLLDMLPRVSRLELDMFPNRTQLHLVAVRPPPAKNSSIMRHPCAGDSLPCSHVCAQAAHSRVLQEVSQGNESRIYTCLCPPAYFLQNERCVRMAECTFNTFYCHSSNTCFNNSKRCDGVKDCKGGEDEERCEEFRQSYKPCPFDQKRCNSDCVSADSLCDDPSRKKKECGSDKFKCSNSSDLCLDRVEVCDGSRDCPDGADEAPALCRSLNCLETEFMCTQGSCVIRSWVCDGESDCPDGSDEVNCENKTCNAWQFQCNDGECIDMLKRCDGQQDCVDFSDEDLCGQLDADSEAGAAQELCDGKEYVCSSNTSVCIPLTARCNGVPDCPGGVDETDCNESRCREGFFRCSQQIWCVPDAQVCDGKSDCDDGSDETSYACKTKNSTTTSSALTPVAVAGGPCQGFVCRSGRCMDWRDVCDKAEHCEHGDDEGGQCGVPCSLPTCEHNCQQTPTGPTCVCPPGFRSEAFGRPPCRDVDECAEREPCAHVCHNAPGSFTCSCHSGHALRTDRRSCKATAGRMALVLARGSAVLALSADGRGASVLFSDDTSANFTGLAYSVRQKLLYVTSELNGTIYEVSTSRANVVITNVGRPTKVAVDWVSGNVYFVDNTPGARRMRVCHPRRRRCAMLQRLPGDVEVAALALDPANKKMFYCLNHEHESVVWSVSLYGHHATDLGEFRRCTGLAVDSYKRRLYVGDVSQIVQMDYGGGNRKTILYNDPHLSTPKGLLLFEDHLYFVTNGSYRLNRCALFGDRTCEPYISRNLNSDSWLIDHETTQRDDIKNICRNEACDAVCVLGVDGPLCVCPDGALQLGNVCYNFDVKQLPLFNGVRGRSRMDGLATGLAVTAVMVVLVATAVWLVRRYWLRARTADTLMPVHFQNTRDATPGPADTAEPAEPAVHFRQPGGATHKEFVNPLQYVKDALQRSLGRRAQPQGAEGQPRWEQLTPSERDSDTESDIDTRDRTQLFHT